MRGGLERLRAAGRLCWRGAGVLGLIGLGAGELVLVRPPSRRAQARSVNRFFRRLLRIVGVAVTVEGQAPTMGALITNHQTYLDILVLGALQPCVFVSKAEIARWPLLGWMARATGTVFVERGRGGSAAAASVGLRSAAEAGVPVVFFPEGTTSNGEGVLPFRSGLLAEVRKAGLPVTAGALEYSVAGPPGATIANEVAYWGDHVLLRHVLRLLTLEGVAVRVRFAEAALVFTYAERKAAAREAQAAVLALRAG